MTFKVEQSGWYRTRDGRLAEVVVTGLDSGRAVIGYIVDEDDAETWDRRGCYLNPNIDSEHDLIEYLGKERPREKKKHKANLSLWSCGQITSAGWSGLLPNNSFVVETRTLEWEVPNG